MASPSSGLVFARRKRSAFKGPMLNTPNPLFGGSLSVPRSREGSIGREGGDARPGTRKSQIIEEEEDEMIDEDDGFEDVDRFSPTDDKDMEFEDVRESMDESVSLKADSEVGNDTTVPKALTKPIITPPLDPEVDPLRPPRSSSLAENRPSTSDGAFLPLTEVDTVIVTTTTGTGDEQDIPKPPEKD